MIEIGLEKMKVDPVWIEICGHESWIVVSPDYFQIVDMNDEESSFGVATCCLMRITVDHEYWNAGIVLMLT